MKIRTLQEQQARIDNINRAEKNNRTYFRRHRIRDYLPGQAVYNLGDYPAPFSIEPTDYDREMLADMAANGVELIQIHEEWNDPIRHLGADKFSCFDPKGLEHFIDLAHSFGIKIIPYISSGFFHELDPDFDEAFTFDKRRCINGMHFKYRECDVGSAAWRNYLLPRTFAVLDRYDFDGIYNDMGYNGPYRNNPLSRDGMNYDPACEDLLGMIYTEIKRRGLVYKVHRGHNETVPSRDRVYDYLWIGESVRNTQPGTGKNYFDYVVPCCDHKQQQSGTEEQRFASTIPFLQFPLLISRGRPLMGKRIEENIPYYGNENGVLGGEYAFNKQVGEYMKEHPNGPYVHSLWSKIPDDPEDYPRWCRYLALYRPMVAPDSVVYMELRDSAEILSPLPADVYATLFVNEKMYLVVSNFTGADYRLELAEPWRDRVTGQTAPVFTVGHGNIIFLEK